MSESTRHGVWSAKQGFAHQLRENQTLAEQCLWTRLANKQLGADFSQQTLLYGWIVDFLAPKWKLVIEVDGSIHDGRKERDAFRDETLLRRGYKTLRFSNAQVFDNIEQVITEIGDALRECGMDDRYKRGSWRAKGRSNFNDSISKALETFRRR